ncbi:MAG: exodeoxyribonuclease III [Gammaproteobacteria bacterium]|nr:exodeoxyribonuclease III [Gammaproteobacteria bacterium]
MLEPNAATTRIATWNVNSLRVRLPHVLQWLESNPVDILALQETKLNDPDFPIDEITSAGYKVVYSGQKTYNGVAILSRQDAADVLTEVPGLDDPQRRFLAANFGDIHVVNLYVPNGESPESDKYTYKLNWLEHVRAYLEGALAAHSRVVVVGDFNIAPDDRDVYDPEAWRERILCTTTERNAFRGLLDTGLQDTFRRFNDAAGNFSWWDYRAAAFRRRMGLRIDHILSSAALIERCSECVIDTVPRGWERPSDHTPVVATYT